MDDIDTVLRAELVRAADTAPVFTALDRRPRPRTPRPHWTALAAAAAAVAVVASGGAWWAGTDDGSVEEASCPALLKFQGRIYQGHGDKLRTPRPGTRLGTGAPWGCGDGRRHVPVRALPGVSPDIAVLTDDGVWVADTVRSLPPEVAVLDKPVTCTHTGTTTVAGQWVASLPMPSRDNEVVLPRTAWVEADEGDTLPLDRWREVTIRIRVTRDTAGGDDPTLAEDTLRGPQRVAATVRCDGKRFVAESFTRAK